MPPPAPVPTIDLASPSAAADLAAAAATLGCAFLTRHGVPGATRDAFFAASAAFFAQPLAVKAAIAADANFRGFTPLGDEALGLAETAGDGGPGGDTATAQPPASAAVTGDRKEGLYFGRDLPAGHSDLALHGPNQWPAGLPGFKAAVEAAQEALEACAERLVPLLGDGLGGDARPTFERAFLTRPQTAMAFLRPLHYPPLEGAGVDDAPASSDAVLGAGEHTDYGFLTLLLVAGGAPGLQIELPGGAWAAVPAGPPAADPANPADDTWPLFFNCGDMLHRWSGGRYASAKHRVLPPGPGQPPRFSAAFFYDPPGDCVCAPLRGSGCGADDAALLARWPPVRYLDYLQARFAATHASYAAATGGGG